MNQNMLIQYTIVGVVVLAACVWVLIKATRSLRGKGGDGCCGCALKDSCTSASKNKKGKPDCK